MHIAIYHQHLYTAYILHYTSLLPASYQQFRVDYRGEAATVSVVGGDSVALGCLYIAVWTLRIITASQYSAAFASYPLLCSSSSSSVDNNRHIPACTGEVQTASLGPSQAVQRSQSTQHRDMVGT